MISFNFNRISLVTLILFYFTSMHIASVESLKWTVLFEPNNCTIKMDETINVKLTIRITENSVNELINSNFSVVSDNDLISLTKLQLKQENDGSYTGNFNLTGIFLGRSFVIVQLNGITPPIDSDNRLTVIVIREVRIIDTVFTVSVATLVSILYINFGAALDMKKVKASFKRPIGPCLALFCHYLFLPLVSYFLGVWLFPDNIEMQLGLFFTGVSPAGGASNVWTVILGGNLDLSIAMTTTSTFAAFGMMPLWIFTLGKTIFDRGNIPVPYRQIATYAIALVVPLGIGLLIQKYSPRCTRFLVRIIKGFSSLLIIFIIVFGIVTNLYLFKLFTWQIFVAGLALPWCGYFAGWLTAVIFRQEYENRLAIAVEGGIQNTGISIFILRFALSQPEADLTTVLPVSVAIMTPFPLLAYFLCYKGRECFRRRHERSLPPEAKHCVETQGNTSGTF